MSLAFQTDNDSNDENLVQSPVLLDLDENSRIQQRHIESSTSSMLCVMDQPTGTAIL